jgi:hypothetical protein
MLAVEITADTTAVAQMGVNTQLKADAQATEKS